MLESCSSIRPPPCGAIEAASRSQARVHDAGGGENGDGDGDGGAPIDHPEAAAIAAPKPEGEADASLSLPQPADAPAAADPPEAAAPPWTISTADGSSAERRRRRSAGGDTDPARTDPPLRCRDPYRGNHEALGWALDAIPRGAALMGAAVFVSTALLNLAKEAAGCETVATTGGASGEVEECTGKVYGMRPTSLLTNISLIVGLVCACLMPLVGSIVDHTRYRRAVGRISGAAVSVLVVLQVFISSETWFAIAISQIFLAFSYSVHLCVALAYLPDLTADKKELMRWNASFTVAQYLSSVLFLVVMVGAIPLFGYQNDSVKSARLSQGIVFILCSVFFGYAWTGLFQARPASQRVPEGSSLVTAGFKKIYRTSRIIWSEHRAIKWCLLSVSLTESAVAAFVTIGITFMTDQLQFNALENGIAILILLISSIPGTKIATIVSNKWNPIRSLQVCLLVWVVNTSIAAAVLQGPGQQVATYCFAVIWGAATGWVYPTERSLYCGIIPTGQDGELMGMYLCSCQILSWLPPLVFTAMNESGVSMRIGVASLNIFFLSSFFVLFLVGSYDQATAEAGADERPNAKSGESEGAEEGIEATLGNAELEDGKETNAVDLENPDSRNAQQQENQQDSNVLGATIRGNDQEEDKRSDSFEVEAPS